MLVELPPHLRLSDQARESVAEQVVYLDPSVRSCRFVGSDIELECISEPGEPDVLRRRVIDLCTTSARAFAKVQPKVLFETPGSERRAADPTAELLSTGQMVPSGEGTYIYQGHLLRLLDDLRHHFERWCVDELGAKRQAYPTTVPARSMVDNGYLASFPHHAMFVGHARQSTDALEAVTRSELDGLRDALAAPERLLAPTVCYHCFEALRQSVQPAAGACFTSTAHCHRHESKNVSGLTRLHTFSMTEAVFVGGDEWVEAQRQHALAGTRAWAESWGLKTRAQTASDPFFALGAERRRAYQTMMGLKIELQTHGPAADQWLAVASFNNHQDVLVRHYGIEGQDGAPLRSGCVGWGLERWAYALLAQWGTDRGRWPAALDRLRRS